MNGLARFRLIGPPVVALLLLPLAVACAPRSSVKRLERQVRELQRENFRLKKDLTEARVRLEMQKESGPTTAAPSRETTAPDDYREEILEQVTEEAEGPAVIYSEPITDASDYTVPAEPVRPAPPPGSQGTGATGSIPQQLMGTAQASLDARDPEAALVHFREIVVNHPEDPVADDAQFGVGECYFQMGRYEEAIDEYRRVVDRFPFGDRVPYAFLKIGFSQLALERRDDALDSFQTVSEAYPGTEAATVARQQIAHLTRPDASQQ